MLVAEDIQAIMDTFTGADGGVSFINLRAFVEEMERRSERGDAAATELLKIVKRFARLIVLAQDPRNSAPCPEK